MLKHIQNTRYNNDNKKLVIVLTKCFYLFTLCKTLNPIRKVRVQLRVKPIKRVVMETTLNIVVFYKTGIFGHFYDPPTPPFYF